MLDMRVRDVIASSVTGVAPDTPVLETVRLMRGQNISCIVIVKEGKPHGIFTERNLVESASGYDADFLKRDISDCMSTPVFTGTQDMRLHEAFNLMASNRIRHLAIVDENGSVQGVITFSDLVRNLGREYFEQFQSVRDIMSRVVSTLPVEAPLRDAIATMAGKNISCVVATDGNAPVGILTERDVTSLVADKTNVREMSIGDVVIGQELVTVQPDFSVYEASRLMQDHKCRRLVVVNGKAEVHGLVTQSDIVQGLESKYIETLKDEIRDKETRLESTARDLSQTSVFLHNILQSSVDMGIVAVDTNLRIAYCNPAAGTILGIDTDYVLGKGVRELHAAKNVDNTAMHDILDCLHPGKSHTFDFDIRRNNEPRHIQSRISGIWDEQERCAGFVCMVRDVTERRQAEMTIRNLAFYDSLTGLPNRALFNDRLSVELSRVERTGKPLALMVMDLDKFKRVNDTMGHHAGDEVLKEVAERLKRCIRKSDTVARMGGDEFFFIHSEADWNGAAMVAEKILNAFNEPFIVEGVSFDLGASLGISLYPYHAREASSLIRLADIAMYMAKDLGQKNHRCNFIFHSGEL